MLWRWESFRQGLCPCRRPGRLALQTTMPFYPLVRGTKHENRLGVQISRRRPKLRTRLSSALVQERAWKESLGLSDASIGGLRAAMVVANRDRSRTATGYRVGRSIIHG